MRKARGRFVAFEGIDGSGKTTQLKLLFRALKRRGLKVKIVDFPRYGKPSSYFVKKYLAGAYGPWQKADPHLISIFYALDRLDAKDELAKLLSENDIVLANRYTASNAHQGAKIRSRKVLRDFFRWVYNFEFKLLKIPKPDLNLLLYLEPKVAIKLIKARGRKTDIHEQSFEHLKQAARAYLEAARLFPREFQIVNCAPENKLRSIGDIHEEVLELVLEHA